MILFFSKRRLFSQLRRGAWQYGWSAAHYRLLARALRATWRVRRQLAESSGAPQRSPHLAAAIAAVEPLFLTPQPGWQAVNPETIVRFAGFVAGIPLNWGRCVQRSLIAYRLLNGYGIPARICFGIHRQDQGLDGHAWVELLSAPQQALGEQQNPYEKYLPVFQSTPPNTPNKT
jgi:hypothetical protein